MALSDDFVNETCKPGSAECCRYLTMGRDGWACQKLTGVGLYIDKRVEAGTMKAKSDNCPGQL